MIYSKYIYRFVSLHQGIVPYYPVRFNMKSKYYEVYNYSTFSWITVASALQSSKLEFFLLERELFLLLGAAAPEKFKKNLKITPLFTETVFFPGLLLPFLYYALFVYKKFQTYSLELRNNYFVKNLRNVLANIDGTHGLLFVSGFLFFPLYEKELMWVFARRVKSLHEGT